MAMGIAKRVYAKVVDDVTETPESITLTIRYDWLAVVDESEVAATITDAIASSNGRLTSADFIIRNA